MKCGPRQSIADATTSRQTTRQDLRSASGEDPVDCPINDHKWDSRSLPFPRTRSRSVPDVMNDHLVVPDLIHDQIFANRKSSKAGLPCRSPICGETAMRAAACSIRVTRRPAASRLSAAIYAKISSRSAIAPRSYRSPMHSDSDRTLVRPLCRSPATRMRSTSNGCGTIL
jgi:hypothetical protein